MKRSISFLLGALLIPLSNIVFANFAFAASTLELSQGINLHVLNGKAYHPSGTLFNRDNRVDLKAGKNQLLLSYTAEIKNGTEYELESSDPVVMSIEASQQTLHFTLPTIKTAHQMRQFNSDQSWLLRTSDGELLAIEIKPLALKGFRIGIDYEQAMREFNQQHSPHQLTKALAPEAEITAAEQAVILKMLQHWYQLATPETQATFREEL